MNRPYRSWLIAIGALCILALPSLAQEKTTLTKKRFNSHFGFAVATGDYAGSGYYHIQASAPFEDIRDSLEDEGALFTLIASTTSFIWHQDSIDMPGYPEAEDHFGTALATGDFDGDGYDDLVIGIPREHIGSIRDAGMITVMYGKPIFGVSSIDSQMIFQNSTGAADSSEEDDYFGSAVAAGDFNGDGYDDLAVGIPGEDQSGVVDSGAVHVFFGSNSGLSSSNDKYLHPNSAGVPGTPGSKDNFGTALASADFDMDGNDDLAIGVPGKTFSGNTRAGCVTILYGHSTNPLSSGTDLNLDSSGILGVADSYDYFGAALITGDFNGDTYPDLAIGTPGNDIDGHYRAGSVSVVNGGSGGITHTNNRFISQLDTHVNGIPERMDLFGFSLASADFDNDGYADLAIGVPGEDIGSADATGMVNLLYGSSTGITTTGTQIWHQNSTGVPDSNQTVGPVSYDWDEFYEGTKTDFLYIRNYGENFGYSLATGDLDRDGYADLIVGVPGEDFGNGMVINIFGGSEGLSGTGSQAIRYDDLSPTND